MVQKIDGYDSYPSIFETMKFSILKINFEWKSLVKIFEYIFREPIIPLVNKNRNNIIHYNNTLECLKAFELINESIIDGATIYNYKRKYPSYCIICKRIHDHENANVKILYGIKTFHCYRNGDSSINISTKLSNFNTPF